ncbi:hypothetical protein CEXT_719041 [Caerostris extrusa]|uniref:Uncharacterized protein n=1 Tax=Caerostris extrusa TaxID=172846 RepID=A0AAV4U441_CAEEX|nr:hypothetical protein CEXT_719041 [Caerostris extrusa]
MDDTMPISMKCGYIKTCKHRDYRKSSYLISYPQSRLMQRHDSRVHIWNGFHPPSNEGFTVPGEGTQSQTEKYMIGVSGTAMNVRCS